MQLIQVCDESVIYAFTASRVGLFPAALDTHYRDDVAALIEKLEVSLIHVCAVGEYRENDVRHRACCNDDISSQHRLSACKQDETDAEFFRLFEYPEPLLVIELPCRLAVHCRIVGAGIAAGAVQVAARGYACDEI